MVLQTRVDLRRRECEQGHRFSTREQVVTLKRGPRQTADAPLPAPPGGLLAAVWHRPLPNCDETS